MKEDHRPIHARIPGLGQRSVKTALAASLVALIYVFAGRNPTFACIGAIFGMGSDLDNSWLNGGNRLIGTIIGGFLGIGLFWVEHQLFPGGNYFFRLPILFLGIGAVSLARRRTARRRSAVHHFVQHACPSYRLCAGPDARYGDRRSGGAGRQSDPAPPKAGPLAAFGAENGHIFAGPGE